MKNEQIEYRFLNMDTKSFHQSEIDLLEYFRYIPNALKRAIPNWKHNQCLIAVGSVFFSEIAAILLSRKISGICPHNPAIHTEPDHKAGPVG